MTAPKLGSGLFSNQSPIHPHLAEGSHGFEGEFGEIWRCFAALFSPMATLAVEEFTLPSAAVANSVLPSVATTNGTVTYTSANGLLNPAALALGALNLVITSNSNSACPTSAVVVGEDAAGNAQTETIALTTGAGTGVKAWSVITSIEFLGGTGTAGTTIVGTGVRLGLKEAPKARLGQTTAAVPFKEWLDTSGTITTPTAGTIDCSNHTYTPNSAPDGATLSYAVFYEYDPTAVFVPGKV